MPFPMVVVLIGLVLYRFSPFVRRIRCHGCHV
jgi:hypothetical protein